MLYDPKWEKKTKTDPFTLDALIAWLERQPESNRYAFCEWSNCLLAQWLRSIDPGARSTVNAPSGFYYDVLGQTINLHHFKEVAAGNRKTFGAALERARALRPMPSPHGTNK